MRRELIQELSGLSTETAVRLHDECYHLVIVCLGDVSVLGLILLLFPDGRVKRRVFHVLLVEQVARVGWPRDGDIDVQPLVVLQLYALFKHNNSNTPTTCVPSHAFR
jgi:hypothetical protein